jgi:hypothetical protein
MKKQKLVLSDKEREEINKQRTINKFVKEKISIYYFNLLTFFLMCSFIPFFACFLIILIKDNKVLDYYGTSIITSFIWSVFMTFSIGRVTLDTSKIRREVKDKLYPDPLVKTTEEFFGKRFEKLH